MEAKDTVMSEEKIINRVTDFHFGSSTNRHDLVRGAVEAQAEISFKAGIAYEQKRCTKNSKRIHRAGIKEVVDYANNFAGIKHNPEWKAKLKDWGV